MAEQKIPVRYLQSLPISAVSKTGAYTLTATDDIVYADASGGAFNVTLPTAVGCTKIYTVTRINSGANAVTVNTTSSQTINGSLTAAIPIQNMSLDFYSDGANWHIK